MKQHQSNRLTVATYVLGLTVLVLSGVAAWLIITDESFRLALARWEMLADLLVILTFLAVLALVCMATNYFKNRN